MSEKSLLAQKIKEAQTEMGNWPEWMKATSKFEGALRDPEERRTAGPILAQEQNKKED